MKIRYVSVLIAGFLVMVFALSVGRSQTATTGKAADGVAATPTAPAMDKMPRDVESAKAKYAETLWTVVNDKKADSKIRGKCVVELARLGDIQAYAMISNLPKDRPYGVLAWAEMVSQVLLDKDTVLELLQSKTPELRRTGILMAGVGQMPELVARAEKSEKDPANIREIWSAKALFRDFRAIPNLLAVADEKGRSEADINWARMALATYLGVEGELTPDEFRVKWAEIGKTLQSTTKPTSRTSPAPAGNEN